MNRSRWMCVLAVLTLVATLANVVGAVEVLVGCWEIGTCVTYFCEGGTIWMYTETKYECREAGFWYTYCGEPSWLQAVGTC